MPDHDADARPDRQVEHERTYEVPDGAVVPAGDDAPGALRVGEVRTVRLRAGYLDTERLDLRRCGVTLRRRTGGDDEGWHLKLPVGTDRRLEVRLPLGRGGDADVPQALLDEVRALVRDRPLRLVATLSTERTEHRLLDADGGALAVVCDDRVAAGVEGGAATSWREWEVELAPGRDEADLDALERAVLAAGARRSDQPSKLGRVLARPQPPDPPAAGSAGALLHDRLTGLVAELHRRDADVRAGRDEGVHRMRVASRRLRSALQTGRPLLAPGATDHLRAELRLLGQVLGPARDAQVLEVRLRAALEQEPSELVLGPVAARVVTELHRDRDRAAARVQDALASERYARLLDDLDAVVDDLPLRRRGRRPAADVVPDLVRRDARRVHRAARTAARATGRAHDTALHEVRKKAKRLRYAGELAEPLARKGSRRLRRRAKALQQALGEHQDAAVTRAVLRRLGVAAHLAGENGFTFGVLLGTERLRAHEAQVRAAEALRRLPALGRAGRWVGGG